MSDKSKSKVNRAYMGARVAIASPSFISFDYASTYPSMFCGNQKSNG